MSTGDATGTVVVTGASRGIGAAAALRLARAGHRVVLGGRDEAALGKVASAAASNAAKPLVAAGDLGCADGVERLEAVTREAGGPLLAVINNAGVIDPLEPIASCDPQRWARAIEINLVGPARVARALLGPLAEAGGRLINVSSGAATHVYRGWSAYCTSKAGLDHLTRCIAAEVPEVTALAFSPGMTATGMQAQIRREGPQGMAPEELARFVAAHEQGELRRPEDVGEVLAALACAAPAAWSGEAVSIAESRVTDLARVWARGGACR